MLFSNDDLTLALQLADIADKLTIAGLGGTARWEKKDDGSPVSEVDHAVEEALVTAITAARSEDRVLGEETGLNRSSRTSLAPIRQWIIDPIDQTRHYLRCNPEFATLIALMVNDEVEIAVVSAPALAHRWWAARGWGAWKDGRRIRVSRTTRLEDAHLSIAGHREWHTQWDWDTLTQFLNRCAYPAGSPGGFLQQMLIAEGAIDVFIEPWGQVWDHAGPSLIIQEAGGTSTTLAGDVPRGGSLLATNGILHQDSLPHFVRKLVS